MRCKAQCKCVSDARVESCAHFIFLCRVFFLVQAYTHHYRKWGIDLEHMWQQVAAMEQVCSDYKSISL